MVIHPRGWRHLRHTIKGWRQFIPVSVMLIYSANIVISVRGVHPVVFLITLFLTLVTTHAISQSVEDGQTVDEVSCARDDCRRSLLAACGGLAPSRQHGSSCRQLGAAPAGKHLCTVPSRRAVALP